MFDIGKIITEQLEDPAIINIVKTKILQGLEEDPIFKEKFVEKLGLKEDIVLLNGSNIKIEVKK